MNRVIMRLFTYSKINNFGAMTWPHYIENSTKMRLVIMRLNCTFLEEPKSECLNTCSVD